MYKRDVKKRPEVNISFISLSNLYRERGSLLLDMM